MCLASTRAGIWTQFCLISKPLLFSTKSYCHKVLCKAVLAYLSNFSSGHSYHFSSDFSSQMRPSILWCGIPSHASASTCNAFPNQCPLANTHSSFILFPEVSWKPQSDLESPCAPCMPLSYCQSHRISCNLWLPHVSLTLSTTPRAQGLCLIRGLGQCLPGSSREI